MEQAWLRTFPSSLRPSGEIAGGGGTGTGTGTGSTSSSSSPLSGRGGSSPESLMRLVPLPPPVERDICDDGSSLKKEMTPNQTWATQVKRTLASDTPCGSIDSLVSLVKEGRIYCGNLEASEQGLRDADRGDDEEREEEEEKGKEDSRRLVSPVRKEGHSVWPQPQQQQLAPFHGGGHDDHHHNNRSVTAGSGAGRVIDREGMGGHSWATVSEVHASSQGSYRMRDTEPPHESVGRPREHQGERSRSQAGALSPWQRPRAERLPGGGSGRGGGGGSSEGDADPYPVYSKRKKVCGADASWARCGSREGNVGGGGCGTSGNEWPQGSCLMSARAPGAGTTDPYEHRQGRQPPPYAVSRRGETNARDYAPEHHREVTTAMGGAQAEGPDVRRGEHGLPRGVAAADERYQTDPPPLYKPLRRRRAATGSNDCGGGDSGGHEVTNDCDGNSGGNAGIGRRPFRLKPAPLPIHMRADSREEVYPSYEQAAKAKGSEARQPYRPETSHRAAPAGSYPQQQPQRRSSEGHGHGYAAKDERRAWGNDLATGSPHRSVKAPRVLDFVSHDSATAAAGGTHPRFDNNSDYPMYRKRQQQQQPCSGRVITTAATIANSHGPQQYRRDVDGSTSASATEESYHCRMSLKRPAGPYGEVYSSSNGAFPPPPPPASSRDHFYDASASPRSMEMSGGGGAVVVPSHEHGTVVVGPAGCSSRTLERREAPTSRWGRREAPPSQQWGRAVRRDAERTPTRTVLVGKDYHY